MPSRRSRGKRKTPRPGHVRHLRVRPDNAVPARYPRLASTAAAARYADQRLGFKVCVILAERRDAVADERKLVSSLTRELPTRREFTVAEVAELTVGVAYPRSPLYAPTLRRLLADAAAGRIPLVSRCVSGGLEHSLVSRAAAVTWIHAQGATLPSGLSEPVTLTEAIERIEALAGELAALKSAATPRT